MSQPKGLKAILEKSHEIGWPRSFGRDLHDHDACALQFVPSDTPFFWVLRESGTHLGLGPFVDKPHCREQVNHPRFISEAFGESVCRWFWFDGSVLIECRSSAELAERIRAEIQANRER